MMWNNKIIYNEDQPQEVFLSSLYNEKTFYKQFIADLQNATEQVIIESPFITVKRLNSLLPFITYLKNKKVQIFIITRNPREHDEIMSVQSELGIRWFENMGIQVLLESGGHHRKLAIIDQKILWEGSLNILSQMNSKEIMRKIVGESYVLQMLSFLKYDRFL